jgi:hypothetical protein
MVGSLSLATNLAPVPHIPPRKHYDNITKDIANMPISNVG